MSLARELHLPLSAVRAMPADDLIGWAALASLEHDEHEAERKRIEAEYKRPPEGSDEALQRELTARAAARLHTQGAGRR